MKKLNWRDALTKNLSWQDEYECIRLFEEFTAQKAKEGRKLGKGSLYWKQFVTDEENRKMEELTYKNLEQWAKDNDIDLPDRIEGVYQSHGGWHFEELECK